MYDLISVLINFWWHCSNPIAIHLRESLGQGVHVMGKIIINKKIYIIVQHIPTKIYMYTSKLNELWAGFLSEPFPILSMHAMIGEI